MSKLLNQIKKSVKEKALDEAFKSDDGVSTIPDVAFDKSAPKVNKSTKNPTEKENDGEDNKKIEAKKGNASNENTKDINHKKYKQVNKASVVSEGFPFKKAAEDDNEDEDQDVDSGDDNDNDGDEDKVGSKEVKLAKPQADDSDTDDDDDDDDDDKDNSDQEVDIKVRKVTKEDLDISEHIDALLGKEELTEEFKAKTQNIFETAVVTAVNEVVEEVVDQLVEQKEAEQEAFLEVMVEKLDDYLDKVVSEWLEENRVEVQTNVRTEIAESFLSGLKNLFEEHYIEIPEDKVGVVEEMVSRIEALESILDEEINKNVALESELTEARKEVLVMEHLEGLSDNQKERLRMLSEGIELTDEESFTSQIEDLKESYFRKEVKVSAVDADGEPVELNEDVKTVAGDPIGIAIAASITRNLRKNR